MVNKKEAELLRVFLGFEFTEATLLTFLPLSYSIIAAVFSCYNMILTKAVAGLVKLSFTRDQSEFKDPLTYVLISMLIIFNVISECWKQKALKAYNSVYVVTVFQVSLVLFSSIGGGIFFHEFELGFFRGVMFAVGVSVVCVGIFCLSSQTNAIAASYEDEYNYPKSYDKRDVSELQSSDKWSQEERPHMVTTTTSDRGNQNANGNGSPSGQNKEPESPPLLEHSPYY